MLVGWCRKEVSWRLEDVGLCKETRRKKLAAEGMPVLCQMECSSVYDARKLPECCCLYTACGVWSVVCNFSDW